MSAKPNDRSTSAKTAAEPQRSASMNSSQRRLAQEVVLQWKGPSPEWKLGTTPKWNKPPMKPVETDPFGCTCGPCKKFWKENFNNPSILSEPVLTRAQETSTMFRPEQDWRIKVGDRVLVNGKHNGVVRFVGLLDENVIAPPVFVGVQCDEQIGSTHNGTMNGKRYFHCPRGHGVLVPYTEVRPLNPPEKTPPVTGNFMFESYQEVIKARTLRRQKMEAMEDERVIPIRQQRTSRISQKDVYHDENDVAYKDFLKHQRMLQSQDSKRAGETQVYHYANTTVKLRGGPAKPKVDPQTRRFARWKEDFGGGERGEKLVKTLRKLHDALNRGRELGDYEEDDFEPEPEEDDDLGELEPIKNGAGTDRMSNAPSSKPGTRHESSRPSIQA